MIRAYGTHGTEPPRWTPRSGTGPPPKAGCSRGAAARAGHRNAPGLLPRSPRKPHVQYQARDPKAAAPRKTGANLPRPPTQLPAASAAPGERQQQLCRGQTSPRTPRRGCPAAGGQSRAALQPRPGQRAALGDGARGRPHAAPEHREGWPGRFSPRREQPGATQHPGQEPRCQTGEELTQTQTKHSRHGTGHSHETTPTKLHAGQPPRTRGRAATLGHLSEASASRDGAEAGLGGERVLQPPGPAPAPPRLAGSPRT